MSFDEDLEIVQDILCLEQLGVWSDCAPPSGREVTRAVVNGLMADIESAQVRILNVGLQMLETAMEKPRGNVS